MHFRRVTEAQDRLRYTARFETQQIHGLLTYKSTALQPVEPINPR